MAAAKDITPTFHIEPGLKVALRTVANCWHRAIANIVKALIRDYCGRFGIEIADESVTVLTGGKPSQSKSQHTK